MPIHGLNGPRRTAYEVSLLAVGIYAALSPRIHPSVAVSLPLRMDLMLLAFLGAWGLVPPGERAPNRRRGRPRGSETVRIWAALSLPWMVAGGLLGAAFVAPWAAFPWVALPAVSLAWLGREGRQAPGLGGSVGGRLHPRPGRPGTRLGLAVLVAAANSALVAGASARGFRVSPEDYAAQDFRVNALLADIPIHDVWAVDLTGRTPATLGDLEALFRRASPFQSTPALLGLGALRVGIGSALGWEDPRWFDENASFVHRLTEGDREGSTTLPGTTLGIWRVLYTCLQEGAVETMNGTAHVAAAATIGEGPKGSRLFLSFRVREVNWTTRLYMRLIDPARRFFVYPSLLRQLAHAWERADGSLGEDTRIGERR